jgi:carboxylate-amine ligase
VPTFTGGHPFQEMAKKKDQAVFDGFGLAVDYLLVESDNLRPIPPASIGGSGKSVSWSTNAAGTGIQLSTRAPEKDLLAAGARIAADVRSLNALAEKLLGGMLLPAGGHPFAQARDAASVANGNKAQLFGSPKTGRIWTSGATVEIPFGDEQGFGRLHTAMRMVLPLIPAISAASPFLEGKRASALSARLMAMIDGTPGMPELTGPFIPEVALDQADYYRIVLEPIARALADHDLAERIDYLSVNQRAVVPSFERGTIAVNVADTQECPGADAAVAEMTVAVINAMKDGRWVSNYLQRAWHESDLLAILKDVAMKGSEAVIANRDFLLMFGKMRETATAGELWRHLYQQLRDGLSEPTRIRIAHILDHGSLAQRILRRTGERPSRERLLDVYGELAACLKEDRPFA